MTFPMITDMNKAGHNKKCRVIRIREIPEFQDALLISA